MGWPSWPMLLWRRSHRRRASSCSRTPTASNVLDTRSPRCWPTASRRHAGGEHPPSGSRTSGRSGRSSTGGSRRASARRRSSLSTSAGDRSRPWTVPPSSYMRADPTCRQAWPWTTAHRAPGRSGSRTATDRAWSTAIPPTVPIARRSTAPWGPVEFDCPHSVFVDRRATDPVVHVADRGNRRIQVFDLDGAFVRSYGSSFLRAPSAFAPIGDKLLVGDLHARLTLVDADDRLVAHVGDGGDSHAEPGWPNAIVAADAIVARRSTPGAFGSPHGLATMSDGTIIVAEWRLGGRIVALRPVSGTQPARRHPAARPGAGRSAP